MTMSSRIGITRIDLKEFILLVFLILQIGSLIFITVDVTEKESIYFDFTLLVFLLLG